MTVEKIIESAKDTQERLFALEPGDRRTQGAAGISCAVAIRSHAEKQIFRGFGGALTESSGYVLSFLPEEKREAVLHAYFCPDTAEGNGYTFARTHLNSCDFSLENWACVPQKDESLSSFSMERPEQYVIPLIKDAEKQKGSPLELMVSPWSPPAWMKDNGSMNHGGHLLPEYRALWAQYIGRYITELKARGLSTRFVSIQNEPAAAQTWDSCLWSAREEGEFAVRHLFPELKKAGCAETGILVWDHNRDLLLERFTQSMGVPGAEAAIAGAAYHWYSGDQYQHVSAVAEAFPHKELVFSEGCVEGDPRNGAWFTGERYAHNIINDLNAGCTAWIDWNIALDLSGGPNHAGNRCDAPVLVDTKSGDVYFQSSFYAIGHFSRYIEPGAKRLALSCTGFMMPATVDGRMGNTLEACALKNPGGSIVFVISNRTEADAVYQLSLDDASPESFRAPARSIQTLIIR